MCDIDELVDEKWIEDELLDEEWIEEQNNSEEINKMYEEWEKREESEREYQRELDDIYGDCKREIKSVFDRCKQTHEPIITLLTDLLYKYRT